MILKIYDKIGEMVVHQKENYIMTLY